MYVRREYRAKKFATGGAVILGQGENAILRPPPGEAPPIVVPDDVQEDSVPAAQVAAAIARARTFRNDVPTVKVQPAANERCFSAPVSREALSWSGRREDRPGRMTLTAAQREAAKISGLSETEYARNLLLLREAKAADPDRYGTSQ